MEIKKPDIRLGYHKTVIIIMTWLAIAPLVSSSFATFLIIENEPWIVQFDHTKWAVFFILTVFTMAFALTPTTYIAIVTGYFIGMEGVILVIGSYQGASVLGYFFSKRMDQNLIDELIQRYPKAKSVLDNVEKKEFMVTVLARLSPALPFAIMNVVLAVAKIRFASFFWGGLIGMFPRTLFFIWIGSKANFLKNAITQNEGLGWIIGISLLVFGVFYFLLRPTSNSQKTR
ncbi:MAG: TVP38/TMEM64 family protein [Reichenbachiella sp.]